MKVIIIGAGVAGLTAGIYAARAGHDVTLYEQGHRPGGLCGSWDRQGYHFEGSLHWLTGSSRRLMSLYPMWEEVGVLDGESEVRYPDPLFVLHDGDATLPLPRDPDRMVEELSRYAPEDRRALRRLRRDLALYEAGFGTPEGMRGWCRKILLTLPMVLRLLQMAGMSGEEYVGKFRSRAVRECIGSVFSTQYNAVTLIYIYALFCMGASGYPQGGSTQLVANMVRRFETLGGRLLLNHAVTQVLVEKKRVKGVVVNGETVSADQVIVASDTRRAIDTLFAEPIETRWARKMRRTLVSDQCMVVTLGIHTRLEQYPDVLHAALPTAAAQVPGTNPIAWVYIYDGSHYPGYAPEGCTPVTVLLFGHSIGYWQQTRDEGCYTSWKQKVVDSVIADLGGYIPEIKGHVEVAEMATPLTHCRHTDSHDGGWMTLWVKNTLPPLLSLLPGNPSGIRGLQFAGHRTLLSGGLPIALQSGRAAALRIGKP